MNWGGWLLWGFVATVMLTIVMGASQGAGLTRMDLPYVLGAMLTPSRDRAKTIGVGVHLLIGWILSLIYLAGFSAWGGATWWRGAVIGLVHAAFLLTAGVHLLPGLHPRMAAEDHGPTVTRQLEPPGFLGLNYGTRTPIAVVAAHVVFGIILGAFYRVPPT